MSVLTATALTASAADDQMEDSNHPVMYVRGSFNGGDWGYYDSYRFTREGDTYTITLPTIDGEFKISSSEWTYNYGGSTENVTIGASAVIEGVANGPNLTANNPVSYTHLTLPTIA